MSEDRVEEVFQEAIDLEGDQRAACLDRACAGDPELRSRVERLLRAFDCGEGFLETPIAAVPVPAQGPDPLRIGRYRVQGVLGTGGHGRVYAAEQDVPKRSVAVKMLRSGAFSLGLQERFAMEIELLGRLDHPCICQVYEAGQAEVEYADGTTTEALFCAMERVDGVPLTEFVRRHGLGLRESMALVAGVADAVQHAHQRGIIHRDLKPQNILVVELRSETDVGEGPLFPGRPKILDFGIARLTDEADRAATPVTLPGTMLGTLGYMSPEQFGGDAVDARCDVWALGVIAWEIVSGTLPIAVRGASLFDMARAVREDEPGPLMRDGRRVERDLETVLRHALAKDPDDRYASAAGIAADLRRWIHREPIVARAPSFGYQMAMLARRHRGIVAAASLAAVALVVSTIVSVVFYVSAERALAQVIDARDEAEEISRFLREDLLEQAAPEQAQGRELTVRDLVRSASAKIEGRFAGRPLVEAAIRLTLARTLNGLGEGKRAVAQARGALRRIEQVDEGGGRIEIEALQALGEALHATGEDGESLRTQERAYELACARLPPDDPLLFDVAFGYGDEMSMQGKLRDAVAFLGDLAPKAGRTLGSEHSTTLKARNNLGLALDKLGRHEAAIAELRDVAEIRRRVLGPLHPNTMTTESNLALALWQAQDLEAARRLCADVLKRRRQVLGDEHRTTLLTWNNLALIQASSHDEEAAVRTTSEALEIARRVLGAEHRDTLRLEGNLASFLLALRRGEEAIPLAREALRGAEATLPEDHWALGWHRLTFASCLFQTGDPTTALRELEKAWAVIEPTLGVEHRYSRRAIALGLECAEKLGDTAAARRWESRRR